MHIQRGELHGQVVRQADLTHFLLTETRYEPDLHLPVHGHNSSYVSFVLQGAYEEIHHQQVEDCSTGSVIFHPADEIHSNNFQSIGSRCLNLHLNFDESVMDVDLSRRKHNRNRSAAGLTTRIYRELCDPDPVSELILDGLAFELLGETLRIDHGSMRIPAWLNQIEDFIHTSFHENLTIAILAAEAGVHPVHLSRTFRRFYRCTAGEYLRSVRIDFACQKLRTTNLEIAEVALRSGFSDQSAFAKAFKHVTQCTPGRFRKMFRSR
ncbi:AraC family transcriptional regulator [bacterium]|nr:AraC family transcriptional regulator [bacterium]MCI0605490.1 AraC family transcriptional regulator [bacterium]